jgi:transcriptional regulator with XRE-family HTH domain
LKMDGKTIKELRNMVHMTQDELARQIGVTPETLNRWESGKNVRIASRLQKVAKAAIDHRIEELNRIKKGSGVAG